MDFFWCYAQAQNVAVALSSEEEKKRTSLLLVGTTLWTQRQPEAVRLEDFDINEALKLILHLV